MTEAGRNEQRSGGQLFFEAAQQYGLTHVFGNPGTTEVHFMGALADTPEMQFFLCLHEDVATGAADGFARIAGRPAIVNLHLAPGLAHGLANLHNAKKARMPVIVTVGEHHTAFGLEDPALGGEIIAQARSMCKWSYAVTAPEEVPAALHRAMLQALTPPLGPVCLVLPNNIMSQLAMRPVSIPTLNIPKPGPAHPQAIKEAVKMLQKATRPLFVVGDVSSAAGRAALLDMARCTNAAIWREPFPTRLDPPTDPLMVASTNKLPYFPKQRRMLLQNADCILLAGVSGFTTHFLYEDDPVIELVPDHIPVIHLDADLGELGKNAKSALPLLGDVDLTLLQMQEQLRKETEPCPTESASPKAPPPAEFRPNDETPLSAAVLGRALRASLPPGTIFVDESITSGGGIWPELVNGNHQLSHILTGRGGSLGYGIPAAIGVQLAAPGSPVLAIIGDGTALYSIQALWTLARYKLPVVTIICSNRNYDIITLEILRAQGSLAAAGVDRIKQYTGLTPPNLNFAALAEGFGVAGRQITKASELVPAIEAAFASNAPALLDVALESSLRNA